MNKRKMFIRMISASLLRRRSRMIVALLAIAIGATILSGLVTIYNDVPRQMGAEFRSYGANMIFTPTEERFSEEDFNMAIDGIKDNELIGATPYEYSTVRMHDQPIQAAGTDFENLKKTSPYWSIEGEWPENSKEILIGNTVASNLQLSLGDKVDVVFTPEDKDLPDSIISFEVTGIVNTGGKEEEYVYMSLDDMHELVGEESLGFDLAEVSISTGSDGLSNYIDSIAESVSSINPALVKRVTASEATVLSKLQGLVFLVTIIVLALTMVSVATTMTAVVSERRKEIGLRKAIGASDGSIIAEFMGEGMLLGAIGGILGALLGFGFAQFVSVNVFSTQIALNWALIPITMIASIIITGIACLFPIRSATRIDPALVLKGE